MRSGERAGGSRWGTGLPRARIGGRAGRSGCPRLSLCSVVRLCCWSSVPIGEARSPLRAGPSRRAKGRDPGVRLPPLRLDPFHWLTFAQSVHCIGGSPGTSRTVIALGPLDVLPCPIVSFERGKALRGLRLVNASFPSGVCVLVHPGVQHSLGCSSM